MSTPRRILKNFVFLSFAQIVTKVLGLILVAYLARVLGAEGFGKIGFAQAILTYNLRTFCEIWRQALRDFAHDKRDRIKDKDILNFIKDNKWYKLKLGIPPTFTMEIKRVMLKLANWSSSGSFHKSV